MTTYDNSGENIYQVLALEEEARRRGISVTQLRMLKAAGDDVIAGIVADNRSNPSRPRSIASEPAAQKGSGWNEPTPIRPYSGQRYIDQQLDQQDTLDRAERERKLSGR